MPKVTERTLPQLTEPPADVMTYDAWLQAYLGVTLPHVAVCPDHYSPLEIAWDIFSERYEDILIMANRGGGKTKLLAAYATSYLVTHPESEICIVAGSEAQSQILLNYIRNEFLPRLRRLFPRHFTNVKESAERIIFPEGSVIYLRAATLKGTNAPHPHKVIFDEIECFDDWQIIQEGLNMAFTDTRKGYKAQNIFASSRKFRFGILQKLLDEADNIGLKVRSWCVFESLMRSPECPNCEKCANAIRADGLSFKQVCRGKGAHSAGFIPLDLVLGKFKELDYQVFDAQWLGLRPSPIGLVFPSFDKRIHVVDGWQFNPNFPTYAGVDFGFQDPTIALFAQLVDDKVIVFHESVHRQKPLTDILPQWQVLNSQFNVKVWTCDPSRPDLIAMMRQAGLNAYPAEKVDKHQRIETIRARLRVTDPTLLINSVCELTIRQMQDYHYEIDKRTGEPTDKLKDGNDDTIDALSYLLVGLVKGGFTYIELHDALKEVKSQPATDKPRELTENEIADLVKQRIQTLSNPLFSSTPVLPPDFWRLPY